MISANQRSTRFIQLDEVGVKWNSKRGWRNSQRSMAGRLMGGGVVQHDVNGQLRRDGAVDEVEELLELDGPVAGR